jgi:hypothetical protein
VTATRAAVSAFVVKLALAGAALAGLGHLVAWEALGTAATQADFGWAILAVGLLPVNVGLETFRFHRLLRSAVTERPPSFATTAVAVVGAYPLGLLTPGRLGDYAGRALYLRGTPVSTTAALTFLERTATLACCILAGTVALPFWIASREVGDLWTWLVPAGLVAGTVLAALVLRPSLAERAIGAALPFRRLRPAIAALGSLPRAEVRRLFALSALRYAVFSLQFVLLLRAFAGEAIWSPAGWLAAAGGVTLVFFAKSAVPGVTLGDLGVREGAAVYFLASFGEAAAFNASLGLFAINLLVPALVGLSLVARLRVDGRAAASVQPSEAPVAATAGGTRS